MTIHCTFSLFLLSVCVRFHTVCRYRLLCALMFFLCLLAIVCPHAPTPKNTQVHFYTLLTFWAHTHAHTHTHTHTHTHMYTHTILFKPSTLANKSFPYTWIFSLPVNSTQTLKDSAWVTRTFSPFPKPQKWQHGTILLSDELSFLVMKGSQLNLHCLYAPR